MLHILLLILKIIGIVLLCILGFILLTLICVLFVPVRYRIEVTREEGEEKPPVVVRAKVTWLLHLLNILILYPAETMIRVRVAVFTLFKISHENKETHGKKEKKKKKTKDADIDLEKKDEETKKEEQEKIVTKQEKKQPEETKTADKEGIPKVTIKAMEPEEEDSVTREDPSFMDKLRALPVIIKKIIRKMKDLFENIQYTIRRFCDKIKSISDNIQYYKEVVESDTFQNSYELCKGELITIVKSLKPQRFEADLVVGMDDPATTGEILGICGILYPLFGGHVNVVGDFERKRIEGRVFIKGRIRVFTFLRTAVRVYFNKDIKKLRRLLKKEAA